MRTEPAFRVLPSHEEKTNIETEQGLQHASLFNQVGWLKMGSDEHICMYSMFGWNERGERPKRNVLLMQAIEVCTVYVHVFVVGTSLFYPGLPSY